MVKEPWDYTYSSVHAHLLGYDELGIVKTNRLLELVDDWKDYLQQAKNNKIEQLQKHTKTGRVLGNDAFLNKAEMLLKRKLRKHKPGPK
jgi:hypothetical protein